MWLNRSEYERLVKLAAQSEFYQEALIAAQTRAENAENALAGERQGRDWIVNQLTSRVVTKHGQYGLDHEPIKAEPPEPAKGFNREPTEHDLAMRDWYIKCSIGAGKSEEDGERIWEAYMRGESVAVETEVEQ